MRPNVTSAAFKADPFAFLAELRQTAPVLSVRLPDGRAGLLITRYDDVATVLADDRFLKNPHNALATQQLRRQPWMPELAESAVRGGLTGLVGAATIAGRCSATRECAARCGAFCIARGLRARNPASCERSSGSRASQRC